MLDLGHGCEGSWVDYAEEGRVDALTSFRIVLCNSMGEPYCPVVLRILVPCANRYFLTVAASNPTRSPVRAKESPEE